MIFFDYTCNTEGGNTEGGNTEGGNTEGGNTEGGNTEGDDDNDEPVVKQYVRDGNKILRGNE